MQYSDLTTALGDLMVVVITNAASATPSNDTNFNNILPRIIDSGEQRIYRELDFLYTRDTVYEANALANQRVVDLPSTTIVLQGTNIITNPNVLSQTPSPGANGNINYTLSINTNTIGITDSNANTPFISVGQWVNILTAVGTNGYLPQSVLQGPFQIASISLNTPGVSLIYTLTGPANATGTITWANTGFRYSTVSGSAQVTATTAEYHGLSIGSIITVGVTTLLGTKTYITAGDYTVTSTPTATTFTFNLPAPASDTENLIFENNNVIAIQYLGNPLSGTKNRVEPVSKDALDILWPTDLSEQGVPKYGALVNNTTLEVGPVPDQNYIVQFVGTFRPAPMSATNTTTYLATTYPDLFLNACMVFGMLYQKDADLPQGAPPGADVTKWENEYQKSKASVLSEIQRQKGQGPNWSSYSPTPESTPSRP